MESVIPGVLSLSKPLEGSVVTLGNFDGVHRGHQVLVRQACTYAKSLGLPAVAYTFDPHPSEVMGRREVFSLMPVDRRVHYLKELGVDLVVVQPFDVELGKVEADEWLNSYLVKPLNPKVIVVGFNFTYGRARKGTLEQLKIRGRDFGFDVHGVAAVSEGEQVISSTLIRQTVKDGQVEFAQTLLGRPFSIVGQVIHGESRGRLMGFPTANIQPEQGQLPAVGVYATKTRILSGDSTLYNSVTNVGYRPTFKEQGLSIETHLLDTSIDLYDQRLEVFFHAMLRREMRFADQQALIKQISLDVKQAREQLA